jgi:hypothetical protein
MGIAQSNVMFILLSLTIDPPLAFPLPSAASVLHRLRQVFDFFVGSLPCPARHLDKLTNDLLEPYYTPCPGSRSHLQLKHVTSTSSDLYRL